MLGILVGRLTVSLGACSLVVWFIARPDEQMYQLLCLRIDPVLVCFAFCPKGCELSGVSICASRILWVIFCWPFSTSNLIVSPSDIPTTLPTQDSAKTAKEIERLRRSTKIEDRINNTVF